MPFKVGVTSGIYHAARAAELATSVKKLGYGLTRGANCMEIPVDVAHEVTFTQGRDIRHISAKQGMEVLIHGDLQIPVGIPERGEWRDSFDRMTKSLRSAVFAGGSYIDFHACLSTWLEMITYAGRKLTMSFCDHEGRFISHILKECKDLRDWLVNNKHELFIHDILSRDERIELNHRVNIGAEKWRKEETEKKVRAHLEKFRREFEEAGKEGKKSADAIIDKFVDDVIITGLPPRNR